MFTIFIRTIIIYFFVVLTLRMLGKRQIGELEPSELVVTIVISEVAALPIQDVSQPIINSLIAIFLLVILEVVVSFGAYKNFTARKILFGTPSVFYEKGHINQKEMEKQRFNLNDLMECVRNTGATSLKEVDFVIMETNGNVSVIPSAQNRTVNTSDLNIESEPTYLSYIIIDNGSINRNNLKRLGFNEEWLRKQLELYDIQRPDGVFCMTATFDGQVVVIPKDGEEKRG
ncbi:MAG: DUF421 domain-containing protein [Clostridia bacterium]|nr:DUF421 domain-containing protein [Clostridia bacterium]